MEIKLTSTKLLPGHTLVFAPYVWSPLFCFCFGTPPFPGLSEKATRMDLCHHPPPNRAHVRSSSLLASLGLACLLLWEQMLAAVSSYARTRIMSWTQARRDGLVTILPPLLHHQRSSQTSCACFSLLAMSVKKASRNSLSFPPVHAQHRHRHQKAAREGRTAALFDLDKGAWKRAGQRVGRRNKAVHRYESNQRTCVCDECSVLGWPTHRPWPSRAHIKQEEEAHLCQCVYGCVSWNEAWARAGAVQASLRSCSLPPLPTPRTPLFSLLLLLVLVPHFLSYVLVT